MLLTFDLAGFVCCLFFLIGISSKIKIKNSRFLFLLYLRFLFSLMIAVLSLFQYSPSPIIATLLFRNRYRSLLSHGKGVKIGNHFVCCTTLNVNEITAKIALFCIICPILVSDIHLIRCQNNHHI